MIVISVKYLSCCIHVQEQTHMASGTFVSLILSRHIWILELEFIDCCQKSNSPGFWFA